MTAYIVMAIIAYAIGSVNFSVIFSRKFAGFDVREKGSGNAGTTNMLRTVGKKAAIITLVCDILKGVVSILISILIGNIAKDVDKAILVQIAGFCAVLGHTFPIFFEFRGGKGVATCLGILLLTNWQIGLICLTFGVLLIAITRMVSLGSIMAAILYPILTIFIHENYIVDGNYVIFGILLGLFVVFNHRKNLQRIISGTENKISFKK
jgi:glycerol-3-phosphate acyltransferase PlsY